jgi:hypothetical protein
MTMTNAERQWLARVMLTISDVAFREPCNAATGSARNSAVEGALRAAQSLVQAAGQAATPNGEARSVLAISER